MKNKILLAVVLLLTAILCLVSVSVKQITAPIKMEEGNAPINIRLLDEEANTVININLEDYIIGVVAAEMPASFELEALKAQAVAARTYALYKKNSRKGQYDLIKGVKDQAYQDNEELLKKWKLNFFKYYLKVREAVEETQNEVITYDGEIINAFYFSMSNGYTENCELVFSEDLPYLNSVPSSWDNASLNNYENTKTFTKADFCAKLGLTCNNLEIENITRSNSNRVLNITINNQTFKGTNFRTLLGLRSTDFDININNEEITITTRGYGRGVGMSQYGANGMAKEGYSYQEILKYYYQNTEINKLEV